MFVPEEGVLARDHHGFADLWVRGQQRLDFPQLDPKTANFHLVIQPPHDFDLAPGPAAARISPVL